MKIPFFTFLSIIGLSSCLNHKSENISLDSTLQAKATSILESKLSELNALSGQAIIMEVQTGQIKAMVGLERKDSATYQPSENLLQAQTLGLIQPLSILDIGST